MISESSLSNEIYEAIYKSKEIEDREYEEALEWMTEIKENPDRAKRTYCEICGHSDGKLEVHHVRRRKYGNETITVCLDCHKFLTSNQRLWDYNNPCNLLDRGMIDICKLKYAKTDIELYRRIEENITASFKVKL